MCSLKQTHSLTHPLTQLPEIAFYIYYTIRQKEGEKKKSGTEEEQRTATTATATKSRQDFRLGPAGDSDSDKTTFDVLALAVVDFFE